MRKFDGKKLRELRNNNTYADILVMLRNKGVCVTYSSFHNWEKGKSIPNADTLGKIASAFGVSTEFFYSETVHINQY